MTMILTWFSLLGEQEEKGREGNFVFKMKNVGKGKESFSKSPCVIRHVPIGNFNLFFVNLTILLVLAMLHDVEPITFPLYMFCRPGKRLWASTVLEESHTVGNVNAAPNASMERDLKVD